ncbi:ATP-binding cassette domain-containing protein [Lactococcus garvieae]|uniref:ATP-binding cassette domain-containing protein n=1 Tax=Lactococcus garvieae TaxID=1363 RepID=A0AAX3NCC0_9LACT|nr:ABC transporter ATP-binding protein/permease [Lactococcus garvieae]NHI69646.1 ABC transporter ATP-binding protein/permease [Lactococcus garvieae]NHJ07265.1 ABC transporter ATP-binding protein/permease [Lactococcus garvieae]WEA13186.1 ATP-binding cassette domain-containing protein [Lactococcus garvieae]
MPVLELKNIRKSYFLGKDEFPVLKGIDLEFERGDFVSLLGESGGGKSTLMNIIGGLDREYDGDVIIDGVAQKAKKEKDMDAYRRDTIGFIFQSFNLINYLSVLDNILISLKMTSLSEKERMARAIELTQQVGLYEHRKKKPAQLSGGQKQRVAIARALASDPEIILADEPTGALDSQNTKEVLALLRQIAQSGKTVIVVTHSQEVADYGTRTIRLADGQIIGDERDKPAYPVPDEAKSFKTKALSYGDVIKTAFKHFTNTWKINLLIAIGTAIGLFSVIFFLGLGTGATKYMNDQVTSLANPNIISVVQRDPANNQGKDNDEAFSIAQQTMLGIPGENINKLKDLDNVKTVDAGITKAGAVTLDYQGQTASSQAIMSWTPMIQSSTLHAGSEPKGKQIVISEADMKKFDQKAYEAKDWKAVIGKTVKVSFQTVDKNNAPVTITEDMEISGVLQDMPMVGTLTSTEALKEMLTANNIDAMPNTAYVTVTDTDKVKDVTKAINEIKDNGKLVFASTNIGSMLDTITDITGIVSTVLAAIAGISLIVSIFMIVVTTYMSVAERTKEIGVLRALGGRRKDVSRMFTAESVILGLSSAVIAIGLAFAGQSIINKALHSLVGGNIVQITSGHIIFAVIIALVIALFSSLAPAARAARLNTIEALAAD